MNICMYIVTSYTTDLFLINKLFEKKLVYIVHVTWYILLEKRVALKRENTLYK